MDVPLEKSNLEVTACNAIAHAVLAALILLRAILAFRGKSLCPGDVSITVLQVLCTLAPPTHASSAVLHALVADLPPQNALVVYKAAKIVRACQDISAIVILLASVA